MAVACGDLCAGSLEGAAMAILRDEASRARLLDPSLAPPIARWALRAGDHLGLGAASARTAILAALIADDPDDLRRARFAVEALAGSGDHMPSRGGVAAWILSLAEAGRARFDRNPAIGDGSEVRVDPGFGSLRLQILLGIPALVAGRDPAAWTALGRAAAPLVATLEAWQRIHLDPSARDIEDATISNLVAQGLAGSDRARVLMAYAGDRRSAARRAEVLAALSTESIGAAVRASWNRWMAEARAALTAETTAVGQAWLASLDASFAWTRSYAWARSFGRPTSPGAGWSWETIADDVAKAVDRIALDPRWSSSVDVQRWGVEDMRAELVADWFPRGFIEIGLREITGDRGASIRALLLEIPPGELRYFRGWRGIPPDADSLGLMLRLAAGLPDPPVARIESWIALLEENVGEDGIPHVWLRRSSAGPTHDPADRDWQGDDCTACLLSLALGLLETDPARFDRLITAIVDLASRRLHGADLAGCVHYTPAFGVHLFALVVARILDREAAPAIRDEARRRGDDLASALERAQRLDGSWGSPQPTAWYLEALCVLRPRSGAIDRAARFLGETQRGDGSWLPELLYYAVGKPGYMVEYRGIEVTTSVCARALAVAARTAKGRGNRALP